MAPPDDAAATQNREEGDYSVAMADSSLAAIVESLRLVRTKSCAFINLCHEEVAEALQADA